MLNNIRGVSPLSNTTSESILERNRAEKAFISNTSHNQVFSKMIGKKSDKNGNDVTNSESKGRKTFAFWTLVCLLFILAIGNLFLTFTILAVLRLGQGKKINKIIIDLLTNGCRGLIQKRRKICPQLTYLYVEI